MYPDLILHNATVATCDAADTIAEAVAVWRDRIVAVGATDELLAHAGPGTRTVDLGRRFVCPGFIDCHVHLTSWALTVSGMQVDLEGTRSIPEALQRIAQRVAVLSEGEWLRGRGWDKNHWAENRFPTATDLDAVTGETPAALFSHDGHSLWANSAAMRLAGISHDTEDPPGGRILRDDSGRPSGTFQESAEDLIAGHIPPYTISERVEALRKALPQAAALGLTGVHNMEARDALRALQELRDADGLSLRVTRYTPSAHLGHLDDLGIGSGFGDERLRLGGVKAFLDGALGAQTAAMLDPYAGSDNSGVLMMSHEELVDLIQRATEARLAVALHAIGDRAVRMALDSYEEVRSRSAGPWPRHRIEHAQHFHPDDIGRCAKLGVIASVQPAHMLADIDTCERHVPDRVRWAFPLRSLAQAGATLAFGSDAPVEIIDPSAGFRAALARQSRNGDPADGWVPEERVTALQALRGMTWNAAFAAGAEDFLGSLEAGKLADLVVLSDDLLATPLDHLAHVRVLGTMVGGLAVYDPEGLLNNQPLNQT